MTTLAGLGHSLWMFGFLQLLSNLGYYALAVLDGPSAPAMYAATGFEMLTSGMGSGAFSVLLLRLTEKRFSATQYALLSSLFALPRVAGRTDHRLCRRRRRLARVLPGGDRRWACRGC